MEPTKMQEKSPECENNKEERATHSIWTTQLTEDVPGDLLVGEGLGLFGGVLRPGRWSYSRLV
jgi:hypothetical protein